METVFNPAPLNALFSCIIFLRFAVPSSFKVELNQLYKDKYQNYDDGSVALSSVFITFRYFILLCVNPTCDSFLLPSKFIGYGVNWEPLLPRKDNYTGILFATIYLDFVRKIPSLFQTC